jgi:hypothetical protein
MESHSSVLLHFRDLAQTLWAESLQACCYLDFLLFHPNLPAHTLPLLFYFGVFFAFIILNVTTSKAFAQNSAFLEVKHYISLINKAKMKSNKEHLEIIKNSTDRNLASISCFLIFLLQ